MASSQCAAVALLVAGLVTLSTRPLDAFEAPPPTMRIESAVADLFSSERERRARAEEVLAAAPEASTRPITAGFSERPRDEQLRVVSFLLSPAMVGPGLAAVERLGAAAAPSVVLFTMSREPDDGEVGLGQGEYDARLLRLLRSQGQATSAALRPLLASPGSPHLRVQAIQLAYDLRDPAILVIAYEALGDAAPKVRRVAVKVLGHVGGVGEVPAILSLAGDRDEGVRKAVHESLVLLGPKAIAPLEAAVAGGQSPANVAAARVLSGLGPSGIAALQRTRPASIPPLLAVLRKHSSKEVTAAVHAVAAPEAVAYLLAALPDEVRLAPRDEGPLAVDLLLQLLEMPPSATDPRPLDASLAGPALLAYLRDVCNPSRFDPAAKVLAMIRETRAVDALIAGLRGYGCRGWPHGNVPVAEAAANALGAIGDPRAILPLVEAVDDTDRDPIVRRAAANSLRDLRDPAGVVAADRFLAAPLSKLRVVQRRVVVLAAILVLGSVIVALAVGTGLELAFHRVFLLLCGCATWFTAVPALNGIPSDFSLIVLALGVLLALAFTLRYWFGRPWSASPLGTAAARELTYGVAAGVGGVVILHALAIVMAILYFW